MAKQVRPVPKGYQTITASITVTGADAFIKFCKKAFGAKELMRMKGPGGSIMHAELQIEDSRIMVSDEMGAAKKSAKTLGSTPLTLFMYVPKCDAVAAKAVKAGAVVRMPLANMFWGDRFGTIEDPFGNIWAIATHIENVSPADMKKRSDKMMKEMAAAAKAAAPSAN
jgi:PhnB protein